MGEPVVSRFFELDEVAGLVEIPSPDSPALDPWNPVFVECAACPTLVPFNTRTIHNRRRLNGRVLCMDCSFDVSDAEYAAEMGA